MNGQIELNTEQRRAHDLAVDFAKTRKAKLLTLGGYAGVGKTTTTGEIVRTLKGEGKKLAMCTLAGKASTVLHRKTGDALGENDFCGTIHKLIYNLIRADKDHRGRPDLEFERRDEKLAYDLIIVDEASMVNKKIYTDLESHGIPILAVGDHGQLPPLPPRDWPKDKPYDFNLMGKPDIKLETILRQAADNPIVKVSMMAREKGYIPIGVYGDSCIKTDSLDYLHKFPFGEPNVQMLCARNKTRVSTNSFARYKRGIKETVPITGDPVICLSNNAPAGLFNGMIGVIEDITYDCQNQEGYNSYAVTIVFDEKTSWRGHIHPGSFGSLYGDLMNPKPLGLEFFDFAYCITTHKFQGSEASHVFVREERMSQQSDDDWRRWLYTAVTRAKDKLIVFKE